MTKANAKIPGPDHPITIGPVRGRITVSAGGRVIANTSRALRLQEASYPAVYYVPRGDADMAALRRSDHTTHCPYKGDASYFSIPDAGGRGLDAVWTYEQPHAAVAAIRDHLAFYPDRVDIAVEQEA